jgi:putative zinc finger protein
MTAVDNGSIERPMECRKVRELADSFLSGELLTETNHDILRHLDGCPPCRADVESRRALRASLRRAFEGSASLSAREGFAGELRERLRQTAERAPQRTRMAAGLWWGAAAAALVFAATVMIFRGGIGSAADAIARAAAGDHRYCALKFSLAERPIPLSEAAQRYDAAYAALETMPPADLTPLLGSGRVLERHACVYAGRRFAHLVIDYHGARISLVVTAAPSSGAAGGPPEGVWSRQEIDAMAVASRSTSGRAVVVVGALDRADMDRFIEKVATPIVQELGGV